MASPAGDRKHLPDVGGDGRRGVPLILLDANLLIYATEVESPFHRPARTWLERELSGDERVGLPWPALLAFLRITTNPRAVASPRTTASAWAQIEEWLDLPAVWIPQPTVRHREVLGRLLSDPACSGDCVPDAHLAALAIEHGLMLMTADSAVAKFPGLRWRNPLRGGDS